jgi:hypothetical protein
LHRSQSGPSQGCRVEAETTKASAMWLSSLGMDSSDTILKDFERDRDKSQYLFNFSFFVVNFIITCDTIVEIM